jgi:hypothetical protein
MGRGWAKAEIAQLKLLALTDDDPSDIAQLVGRSANDVRARLRQIKAAHLEKPVGVVAQATEG